MLRLVLDRRALTRLPVEARQRLMVVLSETLEVDADAVSDFIQEATNMPFNGLDGRFAEPVMRLSFNLKKRSKHRRGNNMEFEEMVALMSRYIVEGEAA
jgi:hypothetical protein